MLAFKQALSRLESATGQAVDALLAMMTDPEAPAASRVRATCAVLELASRDLGPESLQRSPDEDARLDALARGDEQAYYRHGGTASDWQLQKLLHQTYDA